MTRRPSKAMETAGGCTTILLVAILMVLLVGALVRAVAWAVGW